MDPAWLEFEAQVLHVQTDAVKTPTEASITWVQRLALNRWGLRSHGRPRVEKSGWLGGSFWNISWTVLKQFCGLNAMVARVWCHLTRMSSKIAKATVILKPQTSAGEAPFLAQGFVIYSGCFLFGVGVGVCHYISQVSAFVLDELGLDLSCLSCVLLLFAERFRSALSLPLTTLCPRT